MLDTLDCVAPGIPEDPGCFRQREYVTAVTPLTIVSRGWLDVRNRFSAARSLPIEPGRTYTTSRGSCSRRTTCSRPATGSASC